jgi:hypothetical protein
MKNQHFLWPTLRFVLVAGASAGLAWGALPGCSATMPGTTLGTYAVAGTIQTNTCGTNTGAPNPWSFTIQLSKDSTNLYWNWLDGRPLMSGPMATGAAINFDSTEADNLGGPDSGLTACTMQRADNLSVTLGTDAQTSTFTGTMTYAFTVVSGSCAAEMSSAGGEYDTLPCTLEYTLTATKK